MNNLKSWIILIVVLLNWPTGSGSILAHATPSPSPMDTRIISMPQRSLWQRISHFFRFSTQMKAEDLKVTCASPEARQKYTGRESCYARQFEELALQRGYIKSFEVLTQLQKIDQSALGCHLLAHGIGWGTYQREPKNWQKNVQTISSSCNYGAIHGIMEGYLGSLGDHELTLEMIPTFCGERPRADCNHIIGHLMLVQTKADVPKALALCQAFKDKPQQLFYCNTGVFMEYQTAINLVEHGYADQSWLDWSARLAGLVKLCRQQADENAVACWKEIVHAAAVKYRNDPKQVFDLCGTAQVLAGAKECRRHAVGVLAASKKFNLMAMVPACRLPQKNDPSFEGDCYSQLVFSTLSTLPEDFARVEAYCTTLTEPYAATCAGQVRGFKNSKSRPVPIGD